MSFGVAVRTVDAAGGAQLAGGQGWVTVEGQLVVVLGDPVQPHPPDPPHTTGPTMVEGSSWMTIDGVPVCRQGHKASCGHATSGRGWFTLPD